MNQVTGLNSSQVYTAQQSENITSNEVLVNAAKQVYLNIIEKLSSSDIATPSGMPSLEKPKTESVNMMNLCLEAIEQIVGAAERNIAKNSATEALKSHSEQRKEMYDKKIEELKKKVEEEKNSSWWDKFCNVFKTIGAVLGVVTAAISLAAGIASGNPGLIIGASLLMLSSLDSVAQEISTAVTGENTWSLQGGFTKLLSKFMPDSTAQIVMASISAAFALGSGVGTAVAMSKAVNTVSQVTKVIQTIAQGATGFTQIMSGTGTIVKACADYNVQLSQAEIKHIQALLEKLAAVQQSDEENIKKLLEKFNKTVEGMKDVVDKCNEALTAVVGATPSASMA